MNTLNLLQSSQWISNATSSVKISFVYFHPESSLLRYRPSICVKFQLIRCQFNLFYPQNRLLIIGSALLFISSSFFVFIFLFYF